MHVTVIHPFGSYKRGDKITDEAQIDLVVKGENRHHVIRTAEPEEKQPAN